MSGRSNLLPLLLLGGAGWWAWEQGYLGPLVDQVKDLIQGEQGAEEPEAQEDEPEAATITPAAVVEPPEPSTARTKEERFLEENSGWVSRYCKTDPELTAAIMWQESKGNPDAISHRGALGLMQVMPGTAAQMRNNGYTRKPNNRATLRSVTGSIYFGTAYLEWLDGLRGTRNLEWLIRSYNAGPGGFVRGTIPQIHRYAGGGKSAENDGYLRAVFGRYNDLRIQNGKSRINSYL